MAYLLLPLHLYMTLSHLQQVFHWWVLNANLSLPGRPPLLLTLLLLFLGETPGKKHCDRGSSPAGQSSLLSFPVYFPESK